MMDVRKRSEEEVMAEAAAIESGHSRRMVTWIPRDEKDVVRQLVYKTETMDTPEVLRHFAVLVSDVRAYIEKYKAVSKCGLDIAAGWSDDRVALAITGARTLIGAKKKLFKALAAEMGGVR